MAYFGNAWFRNGQVVWVCHYIRLVVYATTMMTDECRQVAHLEWDQRPALVYHVLMLAKQGDRSLALDRLLTVMDTLESSGEYGCV
jgi:hypothetical protein